MPEYRYELRRGDELIATGHLSSEQPFEAGERITIGSWSGIVRSIDPSLGERAPVLCSGANFCPNFCPPWMI